MAPDRSVVVHVGERVERGVHVEHTVEVEKYDLH